MYFGFLLKLVACARGVRKSGYIGMRYHVAGIDDEVEDGIAQHPV